MAKTSKIIPQKKEKASSSRPSGDKAPTEPLPYEYAPGPCILKADFKVENPSFVPGQSSPWMPQAAPNLEDWVQKLASTSFYAERAWRDLAKGVTKDAILRPSSGEEGTKSLVPRPGKHRKRKITSQSEDPKPKTRRVKKKAIALTMDSVQRLRKEEEEEEEKEEEEEEEEDLALVVRYAKAIDVVRPSEPMTATPDGADSDSPNVNQCISSDLSRDHDSGPSLPTFFEEALREARELKTPNMGGGSSIGDPFRD
ncbi:uncharacterized protein [Nicotiana tomentosiformis]|uniref:uncharacterized protein n=1 Tax=Nicotiana tomentosiformis TaxID=4098 RepID=UPI00388C4E7C